MKLKRVMLAAPKSGSGKTIITCALLGALKKLGQSVVSYKCGPDYIDTMFHERIIGIPSKNLDTFFTGEQKTLELFLKNRKEDEFAVLEGVMGVFDGMGGIMEEGSSYNLAKVTKTPIILVVDAKGMGRSVIPLIAGFLKYDKEKLIKGIILNQMSKPYYEIIAPLIEEELGTSVFGYFPTQEEASLKSRYLGLVMPKELLDIKKQMETLSKELEKTVCLEKIIKTAEKAKELSMKNPIKIKGRELVTEKDAPTIAVARDEAFCFYYEDNLSLLKEFGASIEYFSPLWDKELPKCDALLIGGGYPELYAKRLSENKSMLKEIKAAFDKGLPMVAECGGFMYLNSKLIDKNNKGYTMVGALPYICHDTGRLVRFGYIELKERKSFFLPEKEKIKGHEFHYYDSEENGCDCLAEKPLTGREYPCIIEGESFWLGFPHLYYPSNEGFAKSFVEKAIKYKKKAK